METPNNHELGHEEGLVNNVLNNKKLIYGSIIAVVVIVLAIFACYFFAQNGSRKADDMVARAETPSFWLLGPTAKNTTLSP
jgi:ABC-type dipeptide/oligopeptide/nickel transport system permease subunit